MSKMMLFRENVYIPPRITFTGKIANNPICQYSHQGRIEEVGVEGYNRRGVKGWTLYRENEQQTLVVPKNTSANPYGSVLLIPGASILPRAKDEVIDGCRWLRPKLEIISETSRLISKCSQARDSWKDSFIFIEEERDGEEITSPGLRSPQLGALYASLAHWKVTDEVGTIVMPTGTGKTETMLALLVRERPERLLVIVPTSALRDQIANKFATLGILQEFGIVDKEASLPVVGQMRHQIYSPEDAAIFLQSCNVVIATMAVIGRCSDEVQNTLAKECSHLFIDEAHHAPARTWNNFRDYVREAEKPILQFTATPFRRDGKHIGGKSIFTYPLWKAQKENYFTPISFISIWEYNRSLSDRSIAERAIRALRSDLESGYDHVLMARTNNIERAKQVHKIYSELAPDLFPLIVHSDQRMAERSDAISSLQSRRSRIITCVDMLGEGFDLPQLKVAALHDVHKSLAVTIQFVGRFTRTALGIGDATIIANAADADVEEALDDLYSKDSDWNLVLRRLSEGVTSYQQRRSEFLDGFQNAPTVIPIQNIYPKMSMVAYKTTCDDWNPNSIWDFLGKVNLLVEPTINQAENVLLFIVQVQDPVAWGQTKSVFDVAYHLYLIHWDDEQQLLFINSTNNKSTHSLLAKTLAGEDVTLVRGEKVYRCLYGVNRLILSNLGLIHLLSRATQFTMHVGSDIKAGLSTASVSNRRKSNLFSRGYENGERVTIGASHKGRIWSHRIANDISEWVTWCRYIGTKLLNDSISTDKILDHAIIPTEINERPNLVPLTIDWPHYFLFRSDEAVMVELGKEVYPFYDIDLKISSFTDSGPIRFSIAYEDQRIEYEVQFSESTVNYVLVSGDPVYILASGKRALLTDWFQDEYPIIRFEDTSELDYNEISQPKREREPFDISKIECWNWTGIDLTTESQYRKRREPKRLEFQEKSIQAQVITRMMDDYQENYDLIFDDDGTGEIADIVALKAAGDNLLVHLYHCKYSKKDSGARVGDLYEVCGQAQKSIFWRGDLKRLFNRLKLREEGRQIIYGKSRFEKGDLQKLDELRRRSRFLYPKFHIFIVQPGIDVANISTPMLDLLGATELYLQETFAIPLTVIANSKDS